jgi:hypothetical protein
MEIILLWDGRISHSRNILKKLPVKQEDVEKHLEWSWSGPSQDPKAMPDDN